MLNINNCEGNVSQSHSEIPLHNRMAIIKKWKENKCWWECGGIGTLRRCCWECDMVQPWWKTVWLNMELPYDPTIYSEVHSLRHVLCIYTKSWRCVFKQILVYKCSFVYTLFTIEPKCGTDLNVRHMMNEWSECGLSTQWSITSAPKREEAKKQIILTLRCINGRRRPILS